ncbi:MAG: peptidoglycan-binding protein [Clostridia bacterium]|nr:peptidoglycan-binding protein [Clostridia bacterium]
MADTGVTPYVPEYITVHLGPPDSIAENVTVSFPDYIKNVASSEIYPTWSESAIIANIYAQISFALNRIYTEFYPSRGYDFNITSSTAYDQKFIQGRNIFENISEIVDEMFNSYIRRVGFIEPLAAKYCNGTTVTCSGLSQWGSEQLAQQGYNSIEILKYYYGDDIEIVSNAPISEITSLYPGYPIIPGDRGNEVAVIQTALNEISTNYPAIPRVSVDGIFGENTENAVRSFQRVFGLTPDGIVGLATWYKLVYLYVGIRRLAELNSRGQQLYGESFEYTGTVKLGDRGLKVTIAQYMLSVLAEFYNTIPFVTIDGIFGRNSEIAVEEFQRTFGLPVTGVITAGVWNKMYDAFMGIDDTLTDRRYSNELNNLLKGNSQKGTTNLRKGDTDF